MAGSVSGGCVETTVYEEMMDILGGGPPRRLTYGITDDMIWDVGLACGGTIELLAHKLDPGLVVPFREQVPHQEPAALALRVSGESLGQGALVSPHQVLWGGEEPEVLSLTRKMITARAEQGAIHSMPSGDEVFLETFLPAPVLLIVGGVHVAIPLTRFAKELGFRVVVVDPRAKFANRERFPQADEILQEWPDEALSHLAVDNATFVVLLTHDPKIDEPTLVAALKTEAAYIGAIGSRKTHAERFERMARHGVSPEQLGRVYGPIGLDLGGRSPAETALCIIAEVVAVKNGRTGGSLRGRDPAYRPSDPQDGE
jgi:xanthine dehydrogenase accessory factor